MNTVIVGIQLGDEGKARIIDNLANSYDYCVRFNGGNNAGHSIIVGNKKFVSHIVPCGIIHKHMKCIIGPGCVVDLNVLRSELENLKKLGIKNPEKRLFISNKAHLITKEHIKRDKKRENGSQSIGTTKRGVGYAYSDKIERRGKQLGMVPHLTKGLNVCDVTEILDKAIKQKKRILYEGAQGVELDLDYGNYPYVTSSNTLPQYAGIGSGMPLTKDTEVVGVFKCYTTYVGDGSFIGDLALGNKEDKNMDSLIRAVGKEYGSTTGRPRRIAWLDLVQLKHACKISNIDKLVLTKMDVLVGLQKVKVCIKYKNNKPVYKVFNGWVRSDKTSLRDSNFRTFIRFLEKELNKKVFMYTHGPDRKDYVKI